MAGVTNSTQVSPSFRIPMGGQDVEFKLNLFATPLRSTGVFVGSPGAIFFEGCLGVQLVCK